MVPRQSRVDRRSLMADCKNRRMVWLEGAKSAVGAGIEEVGEGVGEVGEGVAFGAATVDAEVVGEDPEGAEEAGEIGGGERGAVSVERFECGVMNAECSVEVR